MTNTPSNQAPPGWYPVTAGSPQLRWWDGNAWTAHVHQPVVAPTYAATPYSAQPVQQAPAGVKVSTVWGWLAGATPVLQFLLFIPLYFSFQSLFTPETLRNSDALVAAELSPSYLLPTLLAWVVVALYVVFAALDWRMLKRNGVPAPFHWAWSFLAFASPGGFAYMIGRSVVIKRRTGRSGAGPMWLYIAVNVVLFIVGIVIVVILFTNLASVFSTTLNTSGGIA